MIDDFPIDEQGDFSISQAEIDELEAIYTSLRDGVISLDEVVDRLYAILVNLGGP